MDNPSEVRDFLTSRRARLTPDQAGLPTYGGNRRVTGLRREEVALLAGLSVDYYVRLERGNLGRDVGVGVGSARAGAAARRRRARPPLRPGSRLVVDERRKLASASKVRPATLRVLDAMASVPAYVRNGRFDILAANQLGRALYSPVFDSPLFAERGPANTARFCFLDPAAEDFWVDWDKTAEDSVAFIRSEAGRSPHDRVLTQLIGELTTRSQSFADRWARHDVKFHRAGVKRLRHPVVGELDLPYESMDLSADAGLRLNVYTPEPDSPEAAALGLLASWTAPARTP